MYNGTLKKSRFGLTLHKTEAKKNVKTYSNYYKEWKKIHPAKLSLEMKIKYISQYRKTECVAR